jgi:hypothetical protein
LLRERGLSVRTFVDSLDERAERLRSVDAEAVHGELFDRFSAAAAMSGVRRAFFTYPVEAGLPDATAISAESARNIGTEMLVNVWQLRAREGATSTLRQHQPRLSEASGIHQREP